MKIGTTEKLKFKNLQRRLKLPLWQATGLLESLWKATYRNAPDGAIGRLSNDEIAASIEWDGDADELVAALVDSRWLDADPTHRLLIHDWEQECESWLRASFERYKKSFATPTKESASNHQVQSAQEAAKELTSNDSLSSLTLSPPPPPSPSSSLEPDWAVVEEVLLAEGVGKARDCCEQAKANSCNPIAIRNLVTFYVSKKPAWGPGALYDRVRTFKDGQNFGELWPPESPKVVRDGEEAKARAKASSEAAKRQRARDETAAAKLLQAHLEERFGPLLDKLPRDEIVGIIQEKWSDSGAFERMLPTKGPPAPGILRTSLLEILASDEMKRVRTNGDC